MKGEGFSGLAGQIDFNPFLLFMGDDLV